MHVRCVVRCVCASCVLYMRTVCALSVHMQGGYTALRLQCVCTAHALRVHAVGMVE